MFADGLSLETQRQTPSPLSQCFDYAVLDSETRIVLKQRTSEIKSIVRRNTLEVFEIGQKLIEVKEKLGHGHYLSWLEFEFGWDERTAQRYVNVVEAFGAKSDIMSDLKLNQTVLYVLLAPSTPDSARTEVLSRAVAGESITVALAKTIVKEHRQLKKAPKQVTVDALSETVESESSTNSFTFKSVENPHTQFDTRLSFSSSMKRSTPIDATEVEPTRYATPLQSLETGEDALNVEGEQATALVATFKPLQQEDSIELPQPEVKGQTSEVAIQRGETVEIQPVEVAEKADSGVESINNDDQLEVVPDKHPGVAELTVGEDVAVTGNLEPQPTGISDRLCDPLKEIPQKAMLKAHEYTASKMLEYFDESSTLKFSVFDKVAREITSDTDFWHLTTSGIFNQEQFEEVWDAIAPHVLFSWIAHWLENRHLKDEEASRLWVIIADRISPMEIAMQLPAEQLPATCLAIAGCISGDEIVAVLQEFKKRLSQEGLKQLNNVFVNDLNSRQQ